MFWLFDSIFLCALKKLCKVTQTRAECKTKNEVFGFAYAVCSQTYEKLVQGERKSKLVFDFSEPPPNFGLSKVTQKNEQIVNSILLIYSLRRSLNPKYTYNLGL